MKVSLYIFLSQSVKVIYKTSVGYFITILISITTCFVQK